MTLVGTEIVEREIPPPRSARTDTGVAFLVGFAERGPAGPTLITSLTDFVNAFGNRVSYSLLYDVLDTYFHEGGASAYISRILGPAASKATRILNDGAAAGALRVDALSEGVWANTLTVQVLAGGTSGTFILVFVLDGVLVDRSPELINQAAAITWASNSRYVRLTALGSANNPAVVAAAALIGGTDDHVNAGDAQRQAALDRFPKDLGPGQVACPGFTSDTAHLQLLTHASSHNRVAILDAPDTQSTTTLKASAAALRGSAIDRYGALFAPWAIIPGIVPGTTRTVPYSAVEMGIIARNDGLGKSTDDAAGGDLGQSQYVIGLSQDPWIDADRKDLNEGGVNIARIIYGGVRTYGYRSTVDPIMKAKWINFGNSRLYMYIAAKADEIAEHFVLAKLDGRGKKISDFGGQLTGMLLPFWEDDSLYGATPEEAFVVDVGPQVNTLARIAAGELHAVLTVRMSPYGERVVIEIAKVATEEAVA